MIEVIHDGMQYIVIFIHHTVVETDKLKTVTK